MKKTYIVSYSFDAQETDCRFFYDLFKVSRYSIKLEEKNVSYYSIVEVDFSANTTKVLCQYTKDGGLVYEG